MLEELLPCRHVVICYFIWRGLATKIMKLAGFLFVFSICLLLPVRADLTIVHQVQGAGQDGEMILKIKGDKARIDAPPKMTTIIDGKTGEITNLMNDRKKVLRISADKMKAATEMIEKFNAKKENIEKAKLTPTGKKEMFNGYETEQYVYETPTFKATYWIASKYPDGAAILKQLQSLNSEVWNSKRMGVPDYRDFPGLPLKMVVSVGGSEVITTLTSIKQDPLNDAEFAIPADFQEVKTPDMNALLQNEKKPAAEVSPKP
ncbi:MAG: hypothetical protein DMF25_05445 [Verrucomicrobia bacterium]|nr:MAG: hypothetical protein DMF25_05445 [Verrucomicrobiota bacterium]